MIKKIAIHSVPRSGSTWLGSIFDSQPDVNYCYQPLFSYDFKDYLDESSSKNKIDEFFKSIASTKDSFIRQTKEKEQGIIPKFKKNDKYTHVCYKEVRYHHILENLLEKDKDMKIIGLIRSPFATIHSWLNAPKEFRPDLGWKIEEEWRYAPKKNANRIEEFNGYEKWKEVAFLFLELVKKYPSNFMLVNYDDLLKNINNQIEKIFNFCELKINLQTVDFINPKIKIDQKDAYSVFRIKNDDNAWMDGLSQSIVNIIIQDADFLLLNNQFKWI